MTRTKKKTPAHAANMRKALKASVAVEQATTCSKVKTELDSDSEQHLVMDSKRQNDASMLRKGMPSTKTDRQPGVGKVISQLSASEQAWRQIITRARLLLQLPTDRKGYCTTTGLGKKSDRKGRNWVVTAVLCKLSSLKHLKVNTKMSTALESIQLSRLYEIVDRDQKIAVGLHKKKKLDKSLAGYVDWKWDARVMEAALNEIERLRNPSKMIVPLTPALKIEESQTVEPVGLKATNSTSLVRQYQPSDQDHTSIAALTEPFSLIRSAMTPIKRNYMSFSKPFSVYASTPASPFAALHKVKSGRITKESSKPVTNPGHLALPSWQTTRSSSFSPTPSTSSSSLNLSRVPSTTIPEKLQIDFGNRVDQALLKIEKWANTWLGGAFEGSNQDLAWESFEFCLRTSDVLDHLEKKEVQVKTEK